MSKRILLFLPRFASGGAEAFVVNAAEVLLEDGYKPVILSIDERESIYDERLRKHGIKRDVLAAAFESNPAVLYLKAYRAFEEYLATDKEGFDVAHFNIAQGEELPFVRIAKNNGIPSRILHSHNSSVDSKAKLAGHKACKSLFPNVATRFLACSDEAARWLLPNKVIDDNSYEIVRNGIRIEDYRFNISQREQMRHDLDVEGRAVFLNVGRLDAQKNQTFLIDVFELIVRDNQKAVLLVAGNGPLERELKVKAEKTGLADCVKWLGSRKDIPALLSAADAFLLPSLFEGFPYTLVEAQASGLPCVASDAVSKRCAITDLCEFAPLQEREFAAGAIAAAKAKTDGREGYAERVAAQGFDVHCSVSRLEEIYEERGGDA